MARATIIDKTEEEDQNLNQDPQQEDTLELGEDLPEEQPQEPETEDLPEKYRGKTVKDLVEMHQNAEKHIGKQSSEVGELRKLVDDFIRGQLESTKAPQEEQEDDLDFYTDPDLAVSKKIDSHPAIKEAREYANQQKKASTLAQLQQKHPDLKEIVQDSKFVEWIESSKIRTELFVRADQQFDYDAADELFSSWKERKNVAKQAVSNDQQARKQAAKTANTGSARGSTERPRKKIYRRSEIIKLMNSDPKRYHAMQDEIMAAYAEGRVK